MAIFRVASNMEVSGNIKLVGPEPKVIDTVNGVVSASYFTSSAPVGVGGFIGDGRALTNVTASSVSGGYVKSLVTGSQTNANLTVTLASDGTAASQGALKVSLTDSPTFTHLTASTLSASSDVKVGGKLTVDGNLEVKGIITGSITRVETTDLSIKDKTIIIASGSTKTDEADGAGIQFGESAVGVSFLFNSASNVLSSSIGIQAPKFVGKVEVGSGNLELSNKSGILDKTTTHVIAAGVTWSDDAVASGDFISGKFVITAKGADSAMQAVEMLCLASGEDAVYAEIYNPTAASGGLRLFSVAGSATGPVITNITAGNITVHIHRVYTKF